MTTNYKTLKDKHGAEVNAFPMGFAFSKQQFAEAMNKLGLEATDTDKVLRIPCGGFIRKSDSQAFGDMLTRLNNEMAEAMKDDEFMIDAIVYELGNHEFCITFDPSDTVEALKLDMNDERTEKCFGIARKKYIGGLNNDNY